MSNYKVLHVWMGTRKVGTLALAANHLAAFEYDSEWISDGFSISPLPLRIIGTTIPKISLFYIRMINGSCHRHMI